MTFDDIMEQLTPERYKDLQRAVELGKWPDGTRLTQAQREHCLQLVIAYGEKHLQEQERVGYIDRGSKQEGETCTDKPQPVKFAQ